MYDIMYNKNNCHLKNPSIIFNKNVDNFIKCKKLVTYNNFEIGRVDITKIIIDSVNSSHHIYYKINIL